MSEISPKISFCAPTHVHDKKDFCSWLLSRLCDECAPFALRTQKPLAILERIVKVHSNQGDWVFDFFAGSGTTGEAAIKHGRKALLCDKNPEAINVMEQRFGVKAEI